MEGLVISLLVFCGLIQYGLPIMCYECNSATNSFCSEKLLPDSLKRNCSEHDRGVTHTMCRKIIQHVDYGVNGQLPQSRVIRACGWDDSKYKVENWHDFLLTRPKDLKRSLLHFWRPIGRAGGHDESKCQGKCYHRAGYGGRQEVCSCTTDFCNHGDQLSTPALLVSTLVICIGALSK